MNSRHQTTENQIYTRIHGLGIDEPLALVNRKGTYYYHADGLGSIVALTNERGKVVQEYEYDSFGNMKHHGNKVKQPYTYTAREYDKETGLYYYRARYYDAKIGRFVSFDPILKGISHTEATACRQSITGFPLMQPQNLHPYVYVRNNPVNYTDPMGLERECCKDEEPSFHLGDFIACLGANIDEIISPLPMCVICFAPTPIIPPWVRVTACVVCGVGEANIVAKCIKEATYCD